MLPAGDYREAFVHLQKWSVKNNGAIVRLLLMRAINVRIEVQLRAAINNVRNIVTVEDCQGFVARASQNCYSCAHDGIDIFDNKKGKCKF